MTNVRVAVIGFGAMGKNHVRVLNSLDDFELVGVFDPLAKQPSGLNLEISRDISRILGLKPDYCVIATPSSTHLEVSLLVAAAGVNALIEKPLATTASDAELLALEFENRGLSAAVGHVERFNPALVELKRRLDLQQLGRVLSVSTKRLSPFPSRISDVGVVKDLAAHDVDIVRWLTNREYKKTAANIRSLTPNAHEDLLSAVCELDDGTVVNHEVNWLSPFKQRTTAVLGEKGLLVADMLNIDLTYFENGNRHSTWSEFELFRGPSEGDVIRYALKREEPLVAEHKAMARLVRHGMRGELASVRDGLEGLKLLEQFLR